MRPEETIDFPIRRVWSRISRLYNTEAAKYGQSIWYDNIRRGLITSGELHRRHHVTPNGYYRGRQVITKPVVDASED